MANFVKSVQYVEIVLPGNTAVSVNLTKGQNFANCIPIYAVNTSGTSLPNQLRVDIFFESGPKVTAKRSDSGGDLTVGVYVVEIDTTGNVSVQQGTWTVDNAQTTGTATITAVTTTRAFVIIAYDHSSGSARYDIHNTSVVFNSTTELGFTRNTGTGNITGHYFIVATSGTDFLVEHATITFGSTDETANATITAITLASTFVLNSARNSGNTNDVLEGHIIVDLSSTTNVRGRRAFNDFGDTTPDASCSDAAVAEVQVISAGGSEFTVERAECNWGNALTQDVTITSIDQTKAVVNAGGFSGIMSSAEAGAADVDGNYATMPFNSDTVVRGTRAVNTDPDGTTMFEVVEFGLVVAAVDDTVAPTYFVRAGFVTPTWTEIFSNYTWDLLAQGFTWDELAAGPVPNADVLAIQARRQAADIFNEFVIGIADFKFDNIRADYSPDNPNSPYTMRPGQIITMKALSPANSMYGIFSGHIDSYNTDSEPQGKITRITASDAGRNLRRTINTSLHTDILVSSLATAISSELGLNLNRINIDQNMNDKISVSFLDNISGGEAVKTVLEAGGHFGFFDGKGFFTLRNRNFDFDITPAASYDNSALNIDYALTDNSVVNDIRITGQPRVGKNQISTVGFIADTPTIESSGTLNFFIEFLDPDTLERGIPVRSLATPVISQDYLLNSAEDGTGTDQTSTSSVSVTMFATSALVSVFHGASGQAFLTKFQVRGDPLQKTAGFISRRLDTDSQNLFGRRTFKIENDLIPGILFADGYAQFIRSRFANPLADFVIEQRNQFPDVYQLDVLDSIHVVDSHTGVNSVFIIKDLTQSISFEQVGQVFTTRYGCTLNQIGTFLVLDKDPEGKLDVRQLGF